ncbi:MAG TPA: hypothetical protein VFO98_09525, partial [Marmoricola sp.]|nr:hypothetical protein [Marmoricola sp.]
CYWPTCNRPAVEVELDHLEEWPQGQTSTTNLGPGCKRHHTTKHSPGFNIHRNPDGSITWTTPTGHSYTKKPAEQPVADWPDPEHVQTLTHT